MDVQRSSCSRRYLGRSSVRRLKLHLDELMPVLLDINMPKMDGYQACLEMRAIEKAMEGRGPSQIIAVTALGGEAEKHRGLVE